MYYIHINRNTIDSNRNNHEVNPPIVVKNGKRGKAKYGKRVLLPAGSEVIYGEEGEKLLPCGARVVIISKEEPVIVE